MCDPVTASLIVGAVTTGAGTIMQSRAKDDAQDRIRSLQTAADETNNSIIADTQALQQDAASAFGADKFSEGVNDQENVIRDKLMDNLVNGFADTTFAETPEIVQRSDDKAQAGAQDFASGFADALARLRGFDQNLFNQNLNIGRVGEATQLNSGFIQGNAQALNSDLQTIDASSPFGDALVAFGGSALASGATAGVGGAKAAVPPKTGDKSLIPARFK